ncbi:MAG: hypothetical protein KAJ75_04975 [Alphaproteobacteria bacterium]|nr:hypothetical protein [Alphaproteobacteria bacterium]
MSKTRVDKLHYKALKIAIETGQVKLVTLDKLLNCAGSPVYNPWDNLMPLLVPILLGLAVLVLIGVIWGLVVMLSGLVVYVLYFRSHIAQTINHRAVLMAISSYESWLSLWKNEGIAVVMSHDSKIGCKSPDGDWKTFVVLNVSELMTKKIEPSEPLQITSENNSKDG